MGLISALVLLRGAWVADLVIVVGLLTVPGWLALRGLRHPGRGISVVVYVPLLSLLVLMLSGSAADLLGLWLGFRGLRLVPCSSLSISSSRCCFCWRCRPCAGVDCG